MNEAREFLIRQRDSVVFQNRIIRHISHDSDLSDDTSVREIVDIIREFPERQYLGEISGTRIFPKIFRFGARDAVKADAGREEFLYRIKVRCHAFCHFP